MSSKFEKKLVKKNLSMFDILKKINIELTGLEKQLYQESSQKFPGIFILGLPRSGTTVLYQLLFNTLDLACVNNLHARFWQVPLIGAYLSEIFLKQHKPNDFRSTYGTTSNIASPHEFSYFWREHLLIEDPLTYCPQEASSRVNWSEIEMILNNISCVFQKPMIHKTLEYTGYHIKNFLKHFEYSFYIFIDREFESVASSIYRARLSNNNGQQHWWSSYPFGSKIDLSKISIEEQIYLQISLLRKQYAKALELVPENQKMVVRYDDLCKDPFSFVRRFVNAYKKLTDIQLITSNCPSSLNRKIGSIDSQLIDRIRSFSGCDYNAYLFN